MEDTIELTEEDKKRDDILNTTMGSNLRANLRMNKRATRSKTEKAGSMDLKLEALRFTMFRRHKKKEEEEIQFPENATKPLDVRLHGLQTTSAHCRLADIRWARKTV